MKYSFVPETSSCAIRCPDCSLRRSPAFLDMPGDQLDFIHSARRGTVQVHAGRQIIDEHAVSPMIFTLYSGWAFRYKTLSDGRRQILNFLLPGDFIGLQEAFVDGSTHGVEAVSDTLLCAFSRDSLWDMFKAHAQLGYDITWLASREESMVDDNLLSAGRRNASERVAMLLMHLFRRADRLNMLHGGALAFPLNQQHIADALGLSLVHTNKTLRKLQAMGLYSLDDGQLRLLNPLAVAQLGDYYSRPQRATPLI